MYGMVNIAVQRFVCAREGLRTWREIAEAAESPSTFSPFTEDDDRITYALCTQSSARLGLELRAFLRVLGRYWVEGVASIEYANILESANGDFSRFVMGLDHMHERMRTNFPNYDPPAFRVKRMSSDAASRVELQVDYYSRREGLLPFVEGIFEGLGTYFNVQISITHVEQTELPCRRMLIACQRENRGNASSAATTAS